MSATLVTLSLWCFLFLVVYVFSTAESPGTFAPFVAATTDRVVAPSSPMATVTTNQSIGLSTYTNELYGITFDFPADWRIEPSIFIENQLLYLRPPNDNTGFSLNVSTPTSASYLDPNTLQVNTYTWTARDYAIQKKNINTHTQAITAPTSHEAIGGKLFSQLSGGSLNFHYVKDNNTIVSNETNAWRLDSIMNKDSVQSTYDSDVYFIHDNVVYQLSFHTDPLNVPYMLPIAEKIVKSFRFI